MSFQLGISAFCYIVNSLLPLIFLWGILVLHHCKGQAVFLIGKLHRTVYSSKYDGVQAFPNI